MPRGAVTKARNLQLYNDGPVKNGWIFKTRLVHLLVNPLCLLLHCMGK